MFSRILKPSLAALLGCSTLLLSGCMDDEEVIQRSDNGFKAFVPIYNNYIANYLAEQRKSLEDARTKLNEEIGKTRGENKPTTALEEKLVDLERSLQRVANRESHGEYFSFKTEADLPKDLVWQDGMDQPEIGDPAAKKGGTFRMPMTAFPATLRRFGPESNHSLRGYLYDNLEISLVGMHPLTNEFIPGIAKRWAIGADGRTMFYEIDPDARYTNDEPIRAEDFLLSAYLRTSDNVTDPFMKQYLKDQIANFTVYGERLLSISLPEPKPLLPLYASWLPASPKFYQQYGPDYRDRYNWLHEPGPGAYYVAEGDVKKGRSITLTRKKDWWAKDKKFYKNSYNVDRFQFTLVRNASKAFEMFRAGEFEYSLLTSPDLWYRKSEMPPVFNGYIERYTFYNQFPRVPRGLYINVLQPELDNQDLRVGLCHATNWQRVIDVIFQGDYSRLPQFSPGFGPYTNPDVKAREFSIEKARAAFAEAGYTREGTDGILVNENGKRLSFDLLSGDDPLLKRMMNILIQDAKKAGLEYKLDARERTSSFKQMSAKKHQITFSGWGVQPPFPRYYQFFHSKNAVDEDGNPKPNTNNINCFVNEEMDKLSLAMRFATDTEEIRKAAWRGQEIIHDEAIFIPGYMTDFVRCGSWRWVRWPDTEEMPFCPPQAYEPFDTNLFWIDEDMKKETLEAIKEGKTFPEVQRTISKFQTWDAPLTSPLPKPVTAPTNN